MTSGAFVAAWATVCAAILLVLGWSRWLQPWLLVASGALAVVGAVLTWRSGRTSRGARPLALLQLYAALGAVLLAVAVGGAAARELANIASQWDTLLAERQARLVARLDERMAALVRRGEEAAALAADRAARPSAHGIFADLAEVRRSRDVAAVAVLDTTGTFDAWAGDHRGRVPEEVRTGDSRTFYAERPLFSYLYFAAPVPGGRERAISAILLQTGLPARQSQAVGFADIFAAETGARPIFSPGPGTNAAWTLTVDGRPVAHADFERVGQAEWRGRVVTQTRRLLFGLTAVAGLLLLVAWLRARPRVRFASAVPLAATTVALGLAPLGDAFGMTRLFSPAFFVLPIIPGDVPLGGLLAVLLPLCALAATIRARWIERRTLPLALVLAGGMLLVALGFAGALHLLVDAASPPLLEGSLPLWGGFQITLVLTLTLLAGLALGLVPAAGERGEVRRPDEAHGPNAIRWGLVVIGVALTVVLSLAVLARWQNTQNPDTWLAALWAIPFVPIALGVARQRGRGLIRWLAAGWLASTAVLPQLWVVHVNARLRGAEREVSTLGLRPDPFLEYLLRQFASEAVRRHERGEVGVELLYRTWVASGFAQEGYPARIALWDQRLRPEVSLSLGGAAGDTPAGGDSIPVYLRYILAQAVRTESVFVAAIPNVTNVNQVMAVPLGAGRAVSVVVPPRRDFERATTLAPFLGREVPGDMRLSLVLVKPGVPPPPPEIHWRPTADGWRSEVAVRFPEGDYHAHVELLLPRVGVRLARAVLLIAADLGILLLLWVLGRAARGGVIEPPGGWRGLLRGFRARVTLTLFGFFLLPTVVFGYVAYRALSGEVVRSARVVAEHAVAQAATDFPDSIGDLRALAAHTGSELLYFQGGELLAASSAEGLELGLYSAWMPPSVYLALQSGEEVSSVATQRLAAHLYLVAYQRLPVTGTLAVPAPLAAGDTAVRQQELAHLILFAVLVGALLTLGLSVAVGRALTTPIGQLRRAAALVGTGQLRVQLPEDRRDEFGELFASFNRMTRRLRRARAQEIRTARVLAWGEMARQIAHEIKNPLTPIKLSVQHLRRAFSDGREDFAHILEGSAEQILKEIDRLTEIARAFSRYGAPAGAAGPLERVDVEAVVHDALTLYSASDRNVAYIEAMQPGLPRVRARTGELKEIVLNLVENARTALEGDGVINISGRLLPNGRVELVVQDNGPGIPPELLPRVFEPHFSTSSSGTGLGLAIVRRLVEGWGGEVAAESEPGAGTAIRVRIPAAE
ncbi:MAG TPA: HAMP domain-containing sensor histidine kinase [Longimicrobiales bacterium]|nr:HAMP domain-containing sensor histidine kinase [Longimicrobiales bacterium]